MKKILIVLFVLLGISFNETFAQSNRVGGPCEGCAAIYESPVPFEQIKSFTALPDVSWDGKKPMGINGIVYKADGKTPAPGVVLYIYHTDATGHYPKKGNQKGWAKRHGYLRGWVRTDASGFYKFGCLRPAPYPGGTEPAHIHVIVKEPGINEYYIDEFLFSDDPLLTAAKKAKLANRGGSGVVKIIDVGNMYKGERNIYLGKNIPGYPLN